jgi:hypothetical protein
MLEAVVYISNSILIAVSDIKIWAGQFNYTGAHQSLETT